MTDRKENAPAATRAANQTPLQVEYSTTPVTVINADRPSRLAKRFKLVDGE